MKVVVLVCEWLVCGGQEMEVKLGSSWLGGCWEFS